MSANRRSIFVLFVAMVLLLGASQMCPAVQLLLNPGFESGAPTWNGDSCGGELEIWSWTYSTIDPNIVPPGPYLCSGFYTPSAWGVGNGGGPFMHTGTGAVKAFSYAGFFGHPAGWRWSSLRQVVDVVPDKDYTASAWVYIHHDWAYPLAPESYVKLEVTELDGAGVAVGTPHVYTFGHDEANTNVWKQGSVGFHSDATTAKVEFRLSNYWPEPWYITNISFDDCAVVGPAVGAKVVEGTVRSGATVISGASVSNGTDTVTTGADGKYTMELAGSVTSVVVRASVDGYFAQRKPKTLTELNTIVDFDLTATGSNVLKNPGFDDSAVQLPYTTAPDSWSVTPANMFGKESFWADSAYEGYPAYIRSGAEAAGIFASVLVGAVVPGQGSIGQTTVVLPGSSYTAKVWVRTYDEGMGWYEGSDQKASLVIEQLNWGGAVIDTHTEYATTFYDWQQLSYTFSALPTAAMVRITGRANLINDYDALFARAVFDDFELNGVAGPAVPSLFGIVTSGGAPLPGATVSLPYGPPFDLSTTTASDGSWTLNPPPSGLYVDASKAGYYAARVLAASPRLTPLNFDLVQIGNNLLTNAGFDSPNPKAGWSEITIGEGNGYARDEASWIAPPQVLSNYNAMALTSADSPLPVAQWIYQRVPVVGGTSYTAKCMTKVWVPAGISSVWGDLSDAQIAGLRIQEYDSLGSPIGAPVVISSQELSTWEEVSTTFTANANTSTIAVGPYAYMTEDARIGYNAGLGWMRVSFDNVEMNGELGPWGLSGTVRAGAAPLAGATVAVQVNGGAATYYQTNAAGQYVATVPYGATCSIRVNKAGFYPMVKPMIITGEMTVDFDMFDVDGNLMFNPNFDDPAGWSTGGWAMVGAALPESNTAAWGLAHFFSVPQAIYMRGPGAEPRVYQDVAVQPGKTYTASVQFMPTKDPRYSTVWGSNPEQTAALTVETLDATKASLGAEVKTFATVTVDNINQWQLLTYTIETDSNTRYLRVGGFAYMVENYDQTLARAIFDNFSLTGDAVPSAKVTDLKKLADGATAQMTGKVVTAKFNGYFYAEESDRTSGIRVTGDANVGDRVDVLGTMGTVGGERIINSTNVIQRSSGSNIAPLGMNGRSAKTGLSAVGLYLTVWGKVSAVNTAGGFFTMSDGSQESLKVYGSATADDYVKVTGALGAEMSGTVVTPVMRSVTVTSVTE